MLDKEIFLRVRSQVEIVFFKGVVYLGRFGALRILTLAQNYSRSLKILDFGF